MMKYKIAIGTDIGRVGTKELPWPTIAERLTQHEMSAVKPGRYFVGGAYSGEARTEANLISRTLLTLDLDATEMTVDEIELELRMGIDGAFVAYSTFSHAASAPRLRVVAPLSRALSPSEYRRFARQYIERWEGRLRFDPCSFAPNQAMYLPRCRVIADAWSCEQDGDEVEVPDAVGEEEVDDLDEAIADRPLDVSDDEVVAHLAAYDPDVLEYDEWLMVGMALHHQFVGKKEGYARWIAWSERSRKHDPARMPARWASMGRGAPGRRRVTFASVIRLSGARMGNGSDNGREVAPSAESHVFAVLSEAAAMVTSIESYDDLKARIQRLPMSLLPRDKRALLTAEIYNAWGKGEGLGKIDIKRALMPAHSAREQKPILPEWLKPWVYVQSTCQFYHTGLSYAIVREAFDARHSREIECLTAESSASRMATVEYGVDTVVDTIFWPGAGQRVEHDGKPMLNIYRETGIIPSDGIDTDGQTVVDLFVAHVELLIEDVGEQNLLIDFLAWVLQNPGKKINWALLLQGAQGTGKSYFGAMMMQIMGNMVRNLEPSALAGRFTGWAYGAVLVVVEEIRVAGESRYEILDRLKPFISNPTIQIEEKGRDHRTVPNFASYLMFSNHMDALPLNDGERRYAPIFSRIQSEKQLFDELGGGVAAGEYFARLFGESERRADALSRYLRDRVIAETFPARGRAPITSARQRMMNLAVSADRSDIEDAIELHECDVVGNQLVDVTWLRQLVEVDGGQLPKARILSAVLLDMGYQPVSGRRVKTKGRANHYIWIRGMDDDQAKELVRAYHGGADYVPG